MFGLIREIREQHGREHATVSILLSRGTKGPIAGNALPGGFLIYSRESKESVRSAAIEAVERLRIGEHSLAVTQHCGTNILVSAALTVIVSAVIVRGSKSWIRRIQGMTTGLVVARITSRPIGIWLQRHATTLPYSEDTEGKAVRGFRAGPVTVFHIRTGPTKI